MKAFNKNKIPKIKDVFAIVSAIAVYEQMPFCLVCSSNLEEKFSIKNVIKLENAVKIKNCKIPTDKNIEALEAVNKFTRIKHTLKCFLSLKFPYSVICAGRLIVIKISRKTVEILSIFVPRQKSVSRFSNLKKEFSNTTLFIEFLNNDKAKHRLIRVDRHVINAVVFLFSVILNAVEEKIIKAVQTGKSNTSSILSVKKFILTYNFLEIFITYGYY